MNSGRIMASNQIPMYSADAFEVHNPLPLTELCFLVTYNSVMNDLDFAFELQTKRKIPKFRHSVILPSVCQTITTDQFIKSVKERFEQLEGTISTSFRTDFLKRGLADRTLAHVQEDALFDICLESDFNQFELQIPIQVSAQVRMNIMNKLAFLTNLKELTLEIGRDFDDPSEALNRAGNRYAYCFSLSVQRALDITARLEFLHTFRFTGVGTRFCAEPKSLLKAFGRNCKHLQTFDLYYVKINCEDLLYLICKDPEDVLIKALNLDAVEIQKEVLCPCSQTLTDLRVSESTGSSETWQKHHVEFFFLVNVPNLKCLNISGHPDECHTAITSSLLEKIKEVYPTSERQLSLTQAVIPIFEVNESWLKMFSALFPKVEFVALIPQQPGSEKLCQSRGKVGVLPQVRKLNIICEVEEFSLIPEELFTSMFEDIEDISASFIIPNFHYLGLLKKLKKLEIDIKDCHNDERTSVQRGFSPRTTYTLTHFTCPNVCLGPDVAREVVNNSPFLTHLSLQCIHGVGLDQLGMSKDLVEFHIESYDDRFSVDSYLSFVRRYHFLKNVSFPALLNEAEAVAVPKLKVLYDLCSERGVAMEIVVFSCNRFWETVQSETNQVTNASELEYDDIELFEELEEIPDNLADLSDDSN